MGFRIELDHTGELGLNAFNQLSVKTVGANDNTFSIEEDGLYVSARPGADGTGGTGYEGTYTDEGIRLGYQNPYNDNTAPRRIGLMHYVHRLYDATMTEPVSEIPAGYTRLDYIQSNGFNFINSEYIPTRDDTFEIDMMFLDDGETGTELNTYNRYYRYVFGTIGSSFWSTQIGGGFPDTGGCVWWNYTYDPDELFYHRNPSEMGMNVGNSHGYTNAYCYIPTRNIWTRVKIATTNNDPLLDDIVYITDYNDQWLTSSREISNKGRFWAATDSECPMYIFYCNFGDAGYLPCKKGSHSEYPFVYNHACGFPCRMRSFVVKETSTGRVKRCYIPCERNSDQKLGMYDLVTGTFCEEQGLENCHFVKGVVGQDTPPLPDLGEGTLNPINFRSNIDYILPGDMCRVNQNNGTWKYYLVTQTQSSGSTSVITNSVYLGVW